MVGRRCFATVATLWFVLYTLIISSVATELTYECYPNNTIKVMNPLNFSSIFANNSLTVCNAVWEDANKNLALISNCEMDIEVLVFFSYLPSLLWNVIGGVVSDVYSINCINIPSQGVFHNISVYAGVDLGIANSTEYPSFPMYSGFYYDPSGTNPVQEAVVGTPVYWIISAKTNDFRIRPDACWAYAGKNIIETVPKKLLLYNGCTLDENLMTDFFKALSHSIYHSRRALLFTFRFYGSEYITMKCNVKICKTGESQTICDQGCQTIGKRDVHHDYEGEMTVTSLIQVIDTAPSVMRRESCVYVWLAIIFALISR